jgi:site-specific recombinase XerD
LLRTSRWYYVQDPIWPLEKHDRNSWFRKRTLYSEILKVVKENPGISTGDVARILGRPYPHIAPLLFHLRRFQAVRYDPVEVERMMGLAEFAKLPCVQQMLSKLSSEKTKGPWLRRLFRYQEWLQKKGYFESITDLLEDYRKARKEEKKYRHIDLIQEYLNSFKASFYYKDSIATIIRGFYRKNRAELPREKITYSRDMLITTPSSTEEYIKPAEIWRIVSDGSVPTRDKAMIAIVLCLGLDESTFVHQFNYYAYPQLAKQLGRDQNSWDLSKAPQISLVRMKTQTRFYNFLPKKALVLLRDWLNVRRDITGSEIQVRSENGVEISEPLFITSQRTPINENFLARTIRESSFKSGVQQQKSGIKRYRIHGHEFRDTFRTTCKIAGVDAAVAEFFIGHSIDILGYDKSPWVYPEHFRKQYQLLEPYLCGEEQWIQVQEEKRKELEDRIQSLESSLTRLTSELSRQVSAQHQSHSESTSSGSSLKKVVKAEEIESYIEKGWEPMLTLPDGRVVMKEVA